MKYLVLQLHTLSFDTHNIQQRSFQYQVHTLLNTTFQLSCSKQTLPCHTPQNTLISTAHSNCVLILTITLLIPASKKTHTTNTHQQSQLHTQPHSHTIVQLRPTFGKAMITTCSPIKRTHTKMTHLSSTHNHTLTPKRALTPKNTHHLHSYHTIHNLTSPVLTPTQSTHHSTPVPLPRLTHSTLDITSTHYTTKKSNHTSPVFAPTHSTPILVHMPTTLMYLTLSDTQQHSHEKKQTNTLVTPYLS